MQEQTNASWNVQMFGLHSIENWNEQPMIINASWIMSSRKKVNNPCSNSLLNFLGNVTFINNQMKALVFDFIICIRDDWTILSLSKLQPMSFDTHVSISKLSICFWIKTYALVLYYLYYIYFIWNCEILVITITVHYNCFNKCI